MQTPKANKESSPSVDTRPGASMHIAYMERTMKAYCVFETDLKHLTFLNTWATILFSCGSFFLAIVAAILVDWVMQIQSIGLNKTSILLIGLFSVLALLFYGLGVWMTISRKSYWNKIGSESKELHK